MSSKSAIQLIILIVIFIILGGVYLKYFSKEKIIVDQTPQQTEKEVNTNSQDNNKNKDEGKIANSKKEKNIENNKTDLEETRVKKAEKKNKEPNTNKKKDNEIPNIVKDVEYLTTDKNGNKYKILATSGRTNQEDKNLSLIHI